MKQSIRLKLLDERGGVGPLSSVEAGGFVINMPGNGTIEVLLEDREEDDTFFLEFDCELRTDGWYGDNGSGPIEVTCAGLMSLSSPNYQKMDCQSRSSSPAWSRVVFSYQCPECGYVLRLRALHRWGLTAKPGKGQIRCGWPIERPIS